MCMCMYVCLCILVRSSWFDFLIHRCHFAIAHLRFGKLVREREGEKEKAMVGEE